MSEESPNLNSYEAMFLKLLPQGPITIENQGEYILLSNGLQMKLAVRKFPQSDRGNFMKWRELYSKEFRQIFDRYIKSDPNFFTGYLTINDIPEAILEDFEKEIYKEGGIDRESYEKIAA